MKAVIVEIKDKYVAVLSDDGLISKQKNNNYELGQVIEMENIFFKMPNKKLIAIYSSIAAALVLIISGLFVYYTPVSYVSMDLNPSIEYSLNAFDTVISADAVNDDGEKILENLDLSNKNINDAIKTTIDGLIENGYISENPETTGEIIITTSNGDEQKASDLATEIKDNVQSHIEETGNIAYVEAVAIGKQRVEEAKKLGVSPGKLNLVEKLKASSENPEEINTQEWLTKPVKEINKTIKENKKNNKPNDDEDNSSDDNSSNGSSSENNSENDVTSPENSDVTNSCDEQSSNKSEEKSKDTSKDNGNPNKDTSKDNGNPNKDTSKDNGNPNKDTSKDNGNPNKDISKDNGNSNKDTSKDNGNSKK